MGTLLVLLLLFMTTVDDAPPAQRRKTSPICRRHQVQKSEIKQLSIEEHDKHSTYLKKGDFVSFVKCATCCSLIDIVWLAGLSYFCYLCHMFCSPDRTNYSSYYHRCKQRSATPTVHGATSALRCIMVGVQTLPALHIWPFRQSDYECNDFTSSSILELHYMWLNSSFFYIQEALGP